MNTTNILLDMYVKKVQAPTLAAAAKKLGLTGPALSNWRNGTSHAQPEAVEAMAKACGLDPEEWVLRVQADRELIPARKQVWLRAAKRLAATAAVIALTFGLDVQTAKAAAVAKVNNNATGYTLCEYVVLPGALRWRRTPFANDHVLS